MNIPTDQELYEEEQELLRLQREEREELEELYRAESRAGVRDFLNEHLRV
jgi:hypothetical protein